MIPWVLWSGTTATTVTLEEARSRVSPLEFGQRFRPARVSSFRKNRFCRHIYSAFHRAKRFTASRPFKGLPGIVPKIPIAMNGRGGGTAKS